MQATRNPYPIFLDLDGAPLDNGTIFYGVANTNPITSPIPIFWDIAGTQPASQPIGTEGGYPVRSGTPANVFANGAYSMSVYDKHGQLVYYFPDSSVNVVSGTLLGVQSFTGNGLYTPTPGTTRVLIELVGGGGSGGGASATAAGQFAAGTGGGSGAYTRAFINVTGPVSVVIGAGGAAVSGVAGGNAGGTTSFGAITAPGGGGGTTTIFSAASGMPNPVAGGLAAAAGVGGNLLQSRGNSGEHIYVSANQNPYGSRGGSGPFGGAAPLGGAGVPGVGLSALSYGAGGGGVANLSSSAAGASGPGAAGVATVYEYA